MRSARFSLLLATGALLATGCGSDQATNVQTLTINDLVGSWRASSAIFSNNANPSQTFDMIANGGEQRYTMLAGGGTRMWVDLGTFHDEWDSQATLNSDTNTLTLTPVEASRPVLTFTVTWKEPS